MKTNLKKIISLTAILSICFAAVVTSNVMLMKMIIVFGVLFAGLKLFENKLVKFGKLF